MHKLYYRTQNTVLTIGMHFSLTSLVCADFIVYGLSYRLDVAHLCIAKTEERQSMQQCNISPPPSPNLMHFSGQMMVDQPVQRQKSNWMILQHGVRTQTLKVPTRMAFNLYSVANVLGEGHLPFSFPTKSWIKWISLYIFTICTI